MSELAAASVTPPHRAFTAHEKTVLLRILENARNADVLRRQIELSAYGEPWFEGSQSFSIVATGDAPGWFDGENLGGGRQIGPGLSVYEKGATHTSDDAFVGEMFLWLLDGRVVDLEYWWVSDEMPDRLPDVDQCAG